MQETVERGGAKSAHHLHTKGTPGGRCATRMFAVTVDDPNADERPSHVAWLVESAFVLGMAGFIAAGVGAGMAQVFGYCSPVPAGEAPDCEGPDRLGGAVTLLLPTVMLVSALQIHLRVKAVPSDGPRIRRLATGLGVALLVVQVLAYWTLFAPPAETPATFLWWTLATVGAVLITGFAPRAVASAAAMAAVALCVLAVRAELAAVVFSGGAGGLAVLACLAMWEAHHYARRATTGVETKPASKPTT